jgi:uncharacterized delta-60 repeat protein
MDLFFQWNVLIYIFNMSMIGQISPFLKIGNEPVFSRFNNTIYKTYSYPDNRILVIGSFTQYGTTTANGIARVNPDGTLDNTFVTGSGFVDGGSAARLSDLAVIGTSILLVGRFTSYNGTAANRIIRLNDNGSIDTSFVYGSGFAGVGISAPNADAVKVVNTNSYLVGGNYTAYNGDDVRGVAIILNNGTLDTNFDIGTGINVGEPNVGVRSVAMDNQSRVLVGGDFINIAGTSILKIGRFSSTGSLDTSFTNSNGFTGGHSQSACYPIIPLTDGYYCGGQFANFKGSLANRLANITFVGQLDPTFNIQNGFNASGGSVLDISLDSSGNLYCVGSFTLFNSQSYPRIIKLTSTGSLDTSFNVLPGGLNGTTWDIDYVSDERIIVAGSFTTYKGRDVPNLIILDSSGNIVS